MSFENSRILLFLFLFAVLVPAAVARYRRGRGRVTLFAAAVPSGEREFLLKELRQRIILSDIFFLLFLGFLVIALAGPRWGLRIAPDYRRGVDMVFAFDLSRSMRAGDSPKDGGGEISRLERGLEIGASAAAVLGDIRAGAAIGKGRGVLAVPLTYDAETMLGFIHGLSYNTVTGMGTNLGGIVDAAAGAFQDSIPSRRLIVLFSDGEDHSGSLSEAAEKAREADITLCAVSLGSDGGSLVPAEPGPDAPDGFLLGADGKAVISARRPRPLRDAAEKTGGIYIDGNRSDAAGLLSGYVNSLSAESRLTGYLREAKPRWRIFVLAAMLCLALSRVMGFSRRRSGPARRSGAAARSGSATRSLAERKDSSAARKNAGIVSAVFCLFFCASCGQIQGKLLVMEGNFFNTRGYYTEAISSYLKAVNYEESAPYAEYGLGSAYFALDEGAAALERYDAAEKNLPPGREDHPELRYRIHYNRGIIHFEKGEWNEAAQSFREALKADSGRIEAKRNLELSLLTINRNGAPRNVSPEGRTESVREGGSGSSSVLFDYLREKERERWKSREWAEESEASGPDY